MKRPDHKAKVKRWLLKGRKLSSQTAWKMWNVTRLSSIINRLKKEIVIDKQMKKTKYGVRYAVYYHLL